MAEYKSRFSELGFYVNGSLKQFRNGKYVTTNPAEIKVLDKLADVTKVEEPKKAEEPSKATASKPKSTPKKGKASAKK